MDLDPGPQNLDYRPLQAQESGHDELEIAGSRRSRSPSRDRRGAGAESRHRYRERSRSPARKERTTPRDGGHRDGQGVQNYRSDRSRTGKHHHRHRHGENSNDPSRDRRRERESTMTASQGRPDDMSEGPSARREHDCWDDRDITSRSASRYSSHQCTDSTITTQHRAGVDVHSSTTTSADAPTIRLPPSETEHHYMSHRCHHHDHDDSPSRSTTPLSHSTHHRHRRRSLSPHRQEAPSRQAVLPYGARALSRWDFAAFEPLFAHYLDKHKHIRMADLDEESVRDRWKGFVARWNAGELEKAWYEPEMFLRVVRLRALEEARVRAAASVPVPSSNRRDGERSVITHPLTGVSFVSEMAANAVSDVTRPTEAMDEDPDDDEDDYAPPLPPTQQSSAQSLTTAPTPPPASTTTPKSGPTIPTLSDLELRRTLEAESRAASLTTHRLARRADVAVRKERLDDILPPRAEAGTRERQLEKRRLTTEAMREFASARETGGDVEVPDAELLGGGDGGGGGGGGGEDDYRRMLEGMRRRRTEREVRREEVVRSRNAERDERIREARAREEERLGVLREMARQRFG